MEGFLEEAQAREMIVEIGKRVYQSGFVGANDGNISCRIGEDTMMVTPTGVSKGFMTAEMMVNAIQGFSEKEPADLVHIREGMGIFMGGAPRMW